MHASKCIVGDTLISNPSLTHALTQVKEISPMSNKFIYFGENYHVTIPWYTTDRHAL